MSDWVWWVLLAGVLGLIEITTTTLVFLMLAVGAAAGAAVAGAGGSVAVQLIVFGGTSVAMLLGVRPIARRHLLHTPSTARTGVAALIGAKAVVLERVDGHGGRIKLGGEIWSARAYDGASAFEAGESVDVAAIDGATALVL